jgi:predicted amidohydrolase
VSWYEDRAHAYRVSVALDSGFLRAIAGKAREHQAHIVINCTVQRDDGVATGTSLLYGPDGELLAAADKQLLMGHEHNFLQRATAPAPVTTTAIGRVGLYTGTDGLICETSRSLALRGAQILCNSLSSPGRCDSDLHIPVRAAENRVFVIAANKVGPARPSTTCSAPATARSSRPTAPCSRAPTPATSRSSGPTSTRVRRSTSAASTAPTCSARAAPTSTPRSPSRSRRPRIPARPRS